MTHILKSKGFWKETNSWKSALLVDGKAPTVTNSITVTYIFVVVAAVAVVHVVGGIYNLQLPSKSTKRTDLISTNPLLTSEGFAYAHGEMTNSQMTCINQTWQVFVDPARVFKVTNVSVLQYFQTSNKTVLHLSGFLPWILQSRI